MDYSKLTDALEKVQQTIQRDCGNTIVLGEGYESFSFGERFCSVVPCSTKRIAYVDGGNAEIIGGADFSLQLIRVYYCVYSGVKRVHHERKDFFVLVQATQEDGKLVYSVEYFENSALPKTISLPVEQHAPEPKQIAELVRKLAELDIVKTIEADVVVRDGDLQSENAYEESAYQKIKQKNICGLAKTTTLFTNTGVSAAAAIHSCSPDGIWVNGPLGKGMGKPTVFFVKLHSASEYVFRFEMFGENINEIVANLAMQSKDPLFIGYPYGLVEADKFGKVPLREVQQIKMMMEARAGKSFKDIQRFANSINAHDKLDAQN